MEKRKYSNPIIRGFNPDPSVCRVGEDYYLVTSSFEYFPGLPIYHSTDLVNWEQIGNCLNFDNYMSIAHANESGGIWAPTIRYHEGTFFVTVAMETATVNDFGNFIIHAQSPTGPWSEPVWVPVGGIDPSIFFEDGKVYYCTNNWIGMDRETIQLGVVNPYTGEILEEFYPIWHGMGGGWMEAPHVYHIGDWYYCMCAEGGTSFGHNEVIARSKSIWGPYEACPYNPILTNRNDTKKQASCCGHGDLLEDIEGNWWMILLGHRRGVIDLSPLGRETYLVPVSWENDWPVIREGRVHAVEEGPLLNEQQPWKGFVDDFTTEEWPLGWQFLRNPKLENYERSNGKLVITPTNAAPMPKDGGSFVCVKQPDLQFEMSVNLSFAPEADEEAAGIMLYLTHKFRYVFGIRKHNGQRELFVQRVLDDIVSEDYVRSVENKDFHLYVKGTEETYTFAVVDTTGKMADAKMVSARFLSNGIVGRGFTGTMMGLYVVSPLEHGTQAVFSDFKVINPER